MATASLTYTDVSDTSFTFNVTVNGLASGETTAQIQYWYSTSPGTQSGQNLDPPSGAPGGMVNLSTKAVTLTGLVPGKHYYIWIQVTGHSTTGDRIYLKQLFGHPTLYYVANYLSTVFHAAENSSQNRYVWNKAIVYVKYSGKWQITRPWVKIAGVWKECG